MAINRKQQLLAEIESTEGGGATFTSASAIQAFEPSLSDTVDVPDRVPAGPTLSRDYAVVGRKTRTVSFRSDLRGSGSTGTAPDFARLLQACGFKASTLIVVTLGAVTSTVGGFQLGEQVYQGASYAAATAVAVVVGILTSGNAPLDAGTASGQKLILAVVSGTVANAATTGYGSGATSTVSGQAAYTGFGYQPTSEKLVNVTSGAYTGTPPAALGEVLSIERAGAKVGALQIITNNSGFVDLNATLLWGTLLNGDTLRSAGNGTATVSASPTQVRTPSLALRHNLDGRNRDLNGSRGDFSLEGEVGAPMQFSWTFSGDPGAASDAPPLATTGLSTVRPPRLLGAIVSYRSGTTKRRIPTKRVNVQLGASVNPNLDANRAGGATGSNVTDRDPAFQVTVDQVHSDLDWEALRDNGTVVGLALVLGDTQGNIVSLVVPVGQVTEVAFGDADGVATFEVTIKPRRIRESGDDEFYIVQI